MLCYCTIRDSGDIYGRRGVEREKGMGVQKRWERTKRGVEVMLFGNKVFVCVLTVSLCIFWRHYNDRHD